MDCIFYYRYGAFEKGPPKTKERKRTDRSKNDEVSKDGAQAVKNVGIFSPLSSIKRTIFLCVCSQEIPIPAMYFCKSVRT